MPITEISAAIASIKAAFDIVKGMNALKNDVNIKEKTTELYDQLISIQTGMMYLQEKSQELYEANQELNRKVKSIEDWEKIESQYDLVKTSMHTFVRVPNKNHEKPDFLHWLCAIVSTINGSRYFKKLAIEILILLNVRNVIQ